MSARAARQPARRTREELVDAHAAARARREAAPLGSDEYRAAAEEIAQLEIALNALEEPEPKLPG